MPPLIVTLTTSLQAPDHHSKRAAAKHQSATKADPGGVARHPDDAAFDRKIGSFAEGARIQA